MKHLVLMSLCVAASVFTSCNGSNRKADTGQQESITVQLTREQIKSASFDELFKQITPQEISEDVFTLVNKDFTVLTGGTPELYNSMVASWGGWGTLVDKPVTWCFLRANRYTLELIKKDLTYTMTYFDNEYRDDLMKFGTQSGRDSKKMEETKLTAVQTPAGNMTFKEAKLIIECKLFEITTVSPDDFQNDEARKFVVDAHAEANDYHKIVFGEITNVWVRK